MLRRLVPRLRVQSIHQIDFKMLQQQGIHGIITDLDNTLVGAKQPLATPELLGWLEQAREHGFKIVIISNNNYERVRKFAEPLDIPFVHRARKPAVGSFKRAIQLLGLPASETAMIGDQMFTDVLGGGRVGVFTILVQPISPADEGVPTRINRVLERIALRRLRKKGAWTEDKS